MHQAIEDFMERPTWQKAAAWIVSLAVVGFLGWQYWLRAETEELTQLEEKVADLEKKIVDERRRAMNLDKLREKVKELDVKLKLALQELPDKREIPDLLASVSNLARDAGLDVSLFRPGAENNKDFYAEVPVSISVEGTYHQVATFFDEVGQLSRIVNINQIGMRDPVVSDSQVRIKTDCVATTFRYLDEAERQAAGNATDDGKRRRR